MSSVKPTITKFQGDVENYYEFLQDFGLMLDQLGLRWTIAYTTDPGFIKCPTPHPDLVGRIDDGTATEKDETQYEAVKDRAAKYQSECRKTIALLMASLTSVAFQRLENIRTHPLGGQTSRQLLMLLIFELKRYFGSWSADNEERIKSKFEKLRPAKTMAEVESLAYQFLRINSELASLSHGLAHPCMLTDQALKAKLHSKMHCPRLVDLFETFQEDANRALTFTECLGKIKIKIDRLSKSFLLVDDKPLTPHTSSVLLTPAFESLAAAPQAPTAEPFNANALVANGNKRNFEGSQPPSSRVPTAFPPGDRQCFNCGNTGHLLKDCNAPFCRNCKTMFNSTNDPLYHHPTVCPQRPPSTFKGNKRSYGNGKAIVPSANKRTNAAYITCYDEEDEYCATPIAQQEDEDDDGLDEYNRYMEALTTHRAAEDARKERL